MERLNDQSGRAFFLGSTQETLERIKARTSIEYPGIIIEYHSPPFKSIFNEADNKIILDKIRAFQPDVTFIAMTCPKQEKWAITHREMIFSDLAICIGNVFDWYAGTQKAIHPFWFKIRLGWFVRIFLRPEIFRRNIGNQMRFFWHVILIFLKLKKV
jgi:N-acetylglucosaminyldiphosphoundecaprenol N-acetyl-beta-D-mannosaminyltransferase